MDINIEMEHCLKLVNNHGLLQPSVYKTETNMSTWIVSVCDISHPSDQYFQCQRLLRNVQKPSVI